MNDKQVIDQQFLYLARLQELQPDKTVRVQKIEYISKCSGCYHLGKKDSEGTPPFCTYKENEQREIKDPEHIPEWCLLPLYNGIREDMCLHKPWYDWHDVWVTRPLLTCSVLANEVAFDPDLRDWPLLKKETDKLIGFLDGEKSPYLLSYSGGKGIHLETFFDRDLDIPEDLREDIKKYMVDVGRTVRTFLASWILEQAEVDPETIRLDWGKIKWSSSSKGSLIRIFGAPRPNGGVKTLIDSIPNEQPKPGDLPLRFPNYIKTWSIAFLQKEIIQAIREEVEKCKPIEPDPMVSWLENEVARARAEGRIKDDDTKKRKGCIGLRNALKGGVSEGHRDAVATGIAYALKFWRGESEEKTTAIINKWSLTCIPPFRERGIDRKIERVYEKQKIPENSSPCHFFIEAGLCKGAKCKVMAKGDGGS